MVIEKPVFVGDSLSPEYWSGWALAYYHWWSARRFGEVFSVVPLDEVVGMYAPLHEPHAPFVL